MLYVCQCSPLATDETITTLRASLLRNPWLMVLQVETVQCRRRLPCVNLGHVPSVRPNPLARHSRASRSSSPSPLLSGSCPHLWTSFWSGLATDTRPAVPRSAVTWAHAYGPLASKTSFAAPHFLRRVCVSCVRKGLNRRAWTYRSWADGLTTCLPNIALSLTDRYRKRTQCRHAKEKSGFTGRCIRPRQMTMQTNAPAHPNAVMSSPTSFLYPEFGRRNRINISK